jgi:hypothetical protein
MNLTNWASLATTFAGSFSGLWEAAFDELKLSRQWVFVGTSLPPADQYLKYLFAVALKHNPTYGAS